MGNTPRHAAPESADQPTSSMRAPHQGANTQSQQPKKRSKGKIAAVVIAAVCVVAVAGAAIAMNLPKPATEPTAEPASTEVKTPEQEASRQEAIERTPSDAVEEEPSTQQTIAKETPTPVREAKYILFIGDDAWENYTPGRADLMMLARLDFEKHLITLITVPRDTKYTLADGTIVKLNQVYCNSGAEAQCAAVSEVIGTTVTNYAVVGFDQLQNIVGYFGGLDITLPYALDYSFYTHDYANEFFYAGEQTLTPWRAMALSRTRTSYSDYGLENDAMRQLVDRRMMVSLMRLAFADPAQTSTLLGALQGFVTTNVSVENQTAWAADLTKDVNSLTVYSTTGPFTGGIDAESQLWLVTPNPDGWSLVMAAVNAGEDPTAAADTYSSAIGAAVDPVTEINTISW